jgi:hypothetical protein
VIYDRAVAPSHEEFIAEGRKRQRRQELVVGPLLAAAGLALRFGVDDLALALVIPAWGAIGLGALMLLHGLFSVASRGTPS